ncbi:D-serine deaminase, pyridoxal phosphate-dependent [Sinosporangium album]|uniref:D-serine deaminase, pyridoxal phosphate-dependent n=1 Tax=Sinosporangium album TaxID=504805 RepID=A0A1G7WSN3_9ACTN|nr:alanine racemase [Sinosporangium album]SDG74922.1 D-serine deaminase, pyridoxal phosphate-dependent [Sinosporangium album]
MGIDAAAVHALRSETLDWRFKAIPGDAAGATVAEFLAGAPTLDRLGTPLLTLDAAALTHNIDLMARWTEDAGLTLAPHGKTTMAPALWQRQLDAGAYGISLANLPQLRVARAFGVQRLMLAGSLLDPAGLAWVGAELDADPRFSFLSWVDSAASVRLMDAALRAAGTVRPVEVCVELGAPGGRTGARDLREALEVGAAVRAAPTLRLAGTAGYEGALAHDASPESLDTVDAYLARLADLHDRLDHETTDPVLTAGGSAYFDRVAAVLGHLPTRVVLRSGAYVVHDDGFYRAISPFSRGVGKEPLRSAMYGFARVISRPEPGLALLDAGKRDLPFDEGLPEPHSVCGRGAGPVRGAAVTAVNDQHAFLSLAPGSDLAHGDVVRLGLSHPCTALDKWSLIPVVDGERVVDLVRTFFS